jgi:hypothetical protein
MYNKMGSPSYKVNLEVEFNKLAILKKKYSFIMRFNRNFPSNEYFNFFGELGRLSSDLVATYPEPQSSMSTTLH